MLSLTPCYLKKGWKVYVEGKLQTRKWPAQDGQDRYSTEIVAHEMQMLDSRGGGSTGFDKNRVASPATAPQQRQAAQAQQAPQMTTAADDFDDEIRLTFLEVT